ncbi:MAG: hypothetical protein NWQ38_02195 [Cellulophaga sp.]|nr:hypothetical protein [Cellulophaga sp.]
MKTTIKIIVGICIVWSYLSCTDSGEAISSALLNTEDFEITAPIVVQERDTIGFLRGSSSKGEVTYRLLSQIPQNSVVLGLRFGEIIANRPAIFNTGEFSEVVLTVEVKKENITKISTVTIKRNTTDPDGDGIASALDEDPNNPCLPIQADTYRGYNPFSSIWANADCDDDGINNGVELDQNTNPYVNESLIGDMDGDGLKDNEDEDPDNPCVPVQFSGYNGFDASNEIWGAGDCDGDGVSNRNELANGSDPYPEGEQECNLNFDVGNFERELRTVDSNNGEGVTVGILGEACGEFIFTGGSLLNQGCFNDDLSVPFIFTPSGPGSSNGTIAVAATTYACLSEDGSSTTEFTIEGFGSYSGSSTNVEFTYTLINEAGDTRSGTLIIRPL